MARVLLVEDDVAISEPLARALHREGYDVVVAARGHDALAQAADPELAVVILDLGLPDMDGVEVCRRLRTIQPKLPVLMLTARAEEVDAVVGLDAGADDYVSKPFRVAELMARVRALLRRLGPDEPDEVNGVRVDPEARRAWVEGRELLLSPKEFSLLALLVSCAGTVLTRDEIMREVWDQHWHSSTKTLDIHMTWLRRKLGDDPASPRWIATVRGVGYRFETGEAAG
jgi:DNA-binding response OmpR family regulator